MHSSYSSGYYTSGFEIMWLLVFAIAIIALIAALVAISKLVEVAKDKGHYKDGAGLLWFIGIFASPIILGIYVVALRDKNAAPIGAPLIKEPDPMDSLPEV